MNAEKTASINCAFSEDPLYPGCLLLSGADDGYLAARGWDRLYIGSEVEAVYSYRDAIAIEDLYHELRQSGETLCCCRELAGRVWRIEARLAENGAHIRASEMDFYSEYPAFVHNSRIWHLSPELAGGRLSGTALLLVRGDGAAVISAEDKLSRLAELSPGKDVSRLRQFMRCFDPGRSAAACVGCGQRLRFLDVYSRGGRTDYLILEYLPLCHGNDMAAVTVYSLGREAYYALMRPYFDYHALMKPLCSAAACAVLDGGSLKPLSRSSCFERLRLSEEEQRDLSSRLLAPCRASGELRCALVSAAGGRYFCAASLSESDGTLHLAMFPFDELRAGIEEHLGCLSPREREVTRCVVNGMCAREIAEKLVIAEGTVKKTVSNIYSKLGVSSKMELMRLLLQYK